MIPLDQEQAAKFLAQNNIKDYSIKQIAGDASFRSYYRVDLSDKSYVLMFAPPSHEDIKPFEKISHFLCDHEFSAPQIFARDEENGFLLLEDLGDDTYGRILKKDVSNETELYQSAIDVLLKLHEIKTLPEVKTYNNAELFREVMLFCDWYLKLKNKTITTAQIAEFKHLWFELFDLLGKENHSLVLRDYHADNLMFLPQRSGFKAVGLLDFQDAVIGSKAYDLASLLDDVRRDVDEKIEQEMLKYYLQNSAVNAEELMRDYEILSLQRNIKIIGIFARLSLRDKKDSYLTIIPKVASLIEKRLNCGNPIFTKIKFFLNQFL